jgi:hypothetical protein
LRAFSPARPKAERPRSVAHRAGSLSWTAELLE